MPIVKIDMIQGRTSDFKRAFMDSVHEAMIETLKLPADDRNIRVTEYAADCFDAKPPYEYFIEIMLFTGRTKETKSQLFQSIVKRLNDKLGIDPQTVFMVLNEQPLENWGVRGGISAADIQFGFKINV